jgi:glutamate racemase
MIGVFDSGLGGLTVVKELMKRLPGRGVVYFGDNARYPYGGKSGALITQYAIENTEFLRAQGAKVLVVACNTASAHAVAALRERFPDMPVYEVVGPALARAAAISEGRVGVIATTGTVESGVYERGMSSLRPEATVFSQACPLFVPLVEEGWVGKPETESIASTYLLPLHSQDIETLILGCTHYPFLRRTIAKIMGPHVRLIDPAIELVNELQRRLVADHAFDAMLTKHAGYRFHASDRTARFERIATEWLGTDVRLAEPSH